jgi:hypothetical protein
MTTLPRAELDELAPLLRRAVTLDPSSLARLRHSGDRVTALVRLPFGVLAARTIVLDDPGAEGDSTYRAEELLAWLDGERADPPATRDADWRGAVPPVSGWQRVDTVPDTDVRPLVRAGALTLKESAEREGVPGAQPRAEVAEALLDSVVLTVTASDDAAPVPAAITVPITLRTLSAVTRLGFLPRGSYVAVDVAGRWIRVAAAYGSVFAERAGLGLTLR